MEEKQDSNDTCKKKSNSSIISRLDLGEVWMWCSDCMRKLYSFDGNEDDSRKCPHSQKMRK